MISRKHKRRGRVGTGKKAGKKAEEAEQEYGGGSDSGDEGDPGAAEEDSAQLVGPSTVKNYVNAIVDLWSKQQAVSGGQVAHPRAYPAVKEIMQTLARKEAARKKSHHNNRRDGWYDCSYNA